MRILRIIRAVTAAHHLDLARHNIISDHQRLTAVAVRQL
jgi:hypothetical protein